MKYLILVLVSVAVTLPLAQADPAPDCRLAAGAAVGPNAAAVSAATYQLTGSCEQRKLCVMDIICKDAKHKDVPTSAVCKANEDGSCPAVADCVRGEGLTAEVARVAPPVPRPSGAPAAAAPAGRGGRTTSGRAL